MILFSCLSLSPLNKEARKFLYGLCQSILFLDSKRCLDLFNPDRPTSLKNGVTVDLHKSLSIFLDQLVLDLASALLVRFLFPEVERSVVYFLGDCGLEHNSHFLEFWLDCVSEASQSYCLGSTDLESCALYSRTSQCLSVRDQGDRGYVSSTPSLFLALWYGQIFGRNNEPSSHSSGINDYFGGSAKFLVGCMLAAFALVSEF